MTVGLAGFFRLRFGVSRWQLDCCRKGKPQFKDLMVGVVSPQESACADSLRHGDMDGTTRRLGAAMGGPGVEEGTATTICADELAKV